MKNPFLPFGELTNKVNQIINNGEKNKMSDIQLLEKQITEWLISQERLIQIQGDEYYRGIQDILNKKRTYKASDGKEYELENMPNNQIVDNQFAKVIDQKVNFLMSKPFTLNCENENEEYARLLKDIFSKKTIKNIKKALKDSYEGGIGWIYPYVSEKGELMIKRFEPWEIMPLWKDSQHEELEMAARVYPVITYEGTEEKTVFHVELYTKTGITKYIRTDDEKLIEDTGYIDSSEFGEEPYFVEKQTNVAYGWDRVPLIPIRANDGELSLLVRVKTLQDALNRIISTFEDNMEQDVKSTIIVIKNFDGTNLSEFRKNLMEFGAVKVGQDGGIDTLEIKVNAENYKTVLSIIKKAIIENAMAYNPDDLKSAGSPNEMSIQSVFNDINIAADETELELQVSFEQLFYFIDKYLLLNNKGNYEDVYVDVIFNRSMIINQSQTITDIKNSVGIVSNKTLLAHHPFVTDVQSELDQMALEEEEAMETGDIYKDAFGFTKDELDTSKEEVKEPVEEEIEEYDEVIEE